MSTIAEMTTRIEALIPEGYDTPTTAFTNKITSIVTDCFHTILREYRWWFMFSGIAVPDATGDMPAELNRLFYTLCAESAFAEVGSMARSAVYGKIYDGMAARFNAKHRSNA